MTERMFPVLPDWKKRGADSAGWPTSVPWGFLAPHSQQAQANHYQTLERLAERGGLSWREMLAVLIGADVRRVNPEADHRGHVVQMLKRWEAAQGTSGSAQDAQRLDPKGAGPTPSGDAP